MRKHGLSWTLLTASLAIHVADEALNDFLPLYNTVVNRIRASYSFIPLPTFSFQLWITGLITAMIILLFLSFLAFRGNRIAMVLSYPYGVLMFANGITHIVGSFYFEKLMPGVFSAPLLLFSSTFLLVQANALAKVRRQLKKSDKTI